MKIRRLDIEGFRSFKSQTWFPGERRQVGVIIRELCRQRGVELVEGHAMPDHVHLCLSIPPK